MQNTEAPQASTMLEMAKHWTPAKKNKPGRKSKLNPYEDVIGYLKKERKFSYKDIHDFFIDKGIRISYPTLVHFAKTRFPGKTSRKTLKETPK